ncbi:integrase catalytic domain-containing protein [Trichonephila clavipes]|uniref:Integrase catalytic domain-containing protein n=1 Tax=Trichonephila clavipes TaxID=2585209 RepID=A0A8X6SKS8_TRICX|nr:integrase catalytic domain-containing protein [Trichonephila clavipes]
MNLRTSSQLMGDLPPIRFQQIRPFKSTGLDFAGPLTTKCAHKRKCSTLLIQIEACLNSRPLTELSPDPSDFIALTPAHFLVGGPIHEFPEPSQPSRSVPLSERWNLIQRLRQYFWDRWSTGIYIDFNLGPSGGELSQIFN